MALYAQKLGRSCTAVPGMECQIAAGMSAYEARPSQSVVDIVARDSVIIIETNPRNRIAMTDRRDDTEKQDRLREAGTLNRTPEKVSDPMFAVGEFFDARDLLQVRYEMVRVVRLGEATLAQAAARFGVSRPTCFRMVKAFDGGRAAGAHPGAARAARAAQDQLGDTALRRGLQSPARTCGRAPAGAADRSRVRRQGASARPGEGIGASSKKNRWNPDHDAGGRLEDL